MLIDASDVISGDTGKFSFNSAIALYLIGFLEFHVRNLFVIHSKVI